MLFIDGLAKIGFGFSVMNFLKIRIRLLHSNVLNIKKKKKYCLENQFLNRFYRAPSSILEKIDPSFVIAVRISVDFRAFCESVSRSANPDKNFLSKDLGYIRWGLFLAQYID